MALQPITKTFMLLGQCVPCLKQGTSKFKVKRLELDENLLMVCSLVSMFLLQDLFLINFSLQYFPKHEFVYAHDPQKISKTGDLVLIELLPKKLTRLITHRVKEVVYPLGDITDPVTGKKVIVGKFRDHIDQVNKVYGERQGVYKYEEAPERGWQEDKKDFTHRETYFKYHESGKDDPSAV